MNTNIYGDFQIYISVPLNLQQLACILFTTILHLFMVVLLQFIEIVTKWGLIFNRV